MIGRMFKKWHGRTGTARVPRKNQRRLCFEALDERRMLCSNATPASAGEPTDCEQYMVELINLARSDGAAEATRNALVGGLQEGPPSIVGEAWIIANSVQPLAWNASLESSSGGHSTALNNADQFFAGGNPHTFGGLTPQQRIAAAGYTSGPYTGPTTVPTGYYPGPENISEAVKQPVVGYTPAQLSAQVLSAHTGLFNDQTVPGRGHRNTMMLGAFKEIGIGMTVGTDNSVSPGNPPPNWDSIYIVQNYGIPSGGVSFLTGVVYNDLDNSLNNPAQRLGYTPSEGLGSVTITATPIGGGGPLTTTTFASGGYSLQLANGSYLVTATGTFGTTTAKAVTIGGANQKMDFPNPSPKRSDIAGRTGGDLWYVQKSNGTGFVNQYWGKWGSAYNWNDVVVGDFNGDGSDDIAGRIDNGRWYVQKSNGTNGFTNEYWGKWGSAYTWSNVAVGDFNGDGIDDIAGRVDSGWWYVLKSNGAGFTNEQWGKWGTAYTWSDVAVGDFNGDGKDDIAGRIDSGWWFVQNSNGAGFDNERWGKWGSAYTWNDVDVGDFNGDGKDDIAGRIDSGWWFVQKSNGAGFDNERWGKWGSAYNWNDVVVGDFNGDGTDDIAGRTGGLWYVQKSNGADEFTNEYWGKWNAAVIWDDVMVGLFADRAGP